MHLICEAQVFSGLITSCHPGPFKDRMRQKVMACMCTDDKELTKGGNLKRTSISMVTTWLNEAWEDITAEMLQKSFQKTSISNSMYGTENNDLWQDSSSEDDHLTQQ